jgi:hypothetical protein
MIPAAPYEAPVSLACGIGGYWMPAPRFCGDKLRGHDTE